MNLVYYNQDKISSDFSSLFTSVFPDMRKTQLNILPHILFGMISSESSSVPDIAKSLKGYTFDKEEIYAFTVAEHEQIIEIHAVNEKIPDKPYTPSTPQTGDNSVDKRIYLAFGIFSAVSAGLFLILYRRKKSGK